VQVYVSSGVSQDPIDGLCEIVDEGVGLARPLVGVPVFFAQTITGTNENTFAACAESEFHVVIAITDNEGTGDIEVMFSCSLVHHADFRFATVTRVRRTVRAIVDTVQMGALGLQFPTHARMNFRNERFREVTASDSGLIGDNNYGQARVV